MKVILSFLVFILTISEAKAYTDPLVKGSGDYDIYIQQTGTFSSHKNYYIEAKIIPQNSDFQNVLSESFVFLDKIFSSSGHLFYSHLLDISEEDSRDSLLDWSIRLRPQAINVDQTQKEEAVLCVALKRDLYWGVKEEALAYDCLPFERAFDDLYYLRLAESKKSLEVRIVPQNTEKLQ